MIGTAARIFERLGAPLWISRAEGELARIGGRQPASELTATEHRVAELVAEGLRNREVAAALFVSEKTVEATLSRVYAKLGVRSRAELTRTLTDLRPTPAARPPDASKV
jgi:DNA-binding CsgD family transcriptional regulator